MIPVLGVPILANPDLLYAMLASIDMEVGKIVVIDNGGVVDAARVGSAEVVTPGHNIGVAASWNRIITGNPAPWWAIVNSDLAFAPGDLAKLIWRMGQAGGLAMLGDFSCFAVAQDAIDRAGTFDENFMPCYFEDNDYDYRCRLAHVPMIALPFGYAHQRSSTIKNSDLYRRENSRTFPLNAAYFMSKWGGPPWAETYTTPFNNGGDFRVWTPDPARIAAQRWEIEPT